MTYSYGFSTVGTQKLKWYPRLGIFKNSTGSCKYNPNTHEGWSYEPWQVCGMIDGIAVFNNFRYSVTTSCHQGVLRGMFKPAGRRVITTEFSDGLQGKSLADVVFTLREELEEREQLAIKGREKSFQGQWRRQRINCIKADILYIVRRHKIEIPEWLKPAAGFTYADDLTDIILEDL